MKTVFCGKILTMKILHISLLFTLPLLAFSCGGGDDDSGSTSGASSAITYSCNDLVAGATLPGEEGWWNLTIVPDDPIGPTAIGDMTFVVSGDPGIEGDVVLSILSVNGSPNILSDPGTSVTWDLDTAGVFTMEIIWPFADLDLNTVWRIDGQMSEDKGSISGGGEAQVVDAVTGFVLFSDTATCNMTIIE